MRVALVAVLLATAVAVAGCTGPGGPQDDDGAEGGTTTVENERGADPRNPPNATTRMNRTDANASALVAPGP